jgi:hypothetical protein
VQLHRLAGVLSIWPSSAPMVVIGGTWEEPVDAAVLQEVAGLVALLLVLVCADGGRCGGPARPLGRDWPREREASRRC